MNRKILFTDLDGTLLNDERAITPRNRAAIEEALADGHIIVISTGRPLASARIQAERLGLTKQGCYAITFNGGLICNLYSGEPIYSHPIPLDLVEPLFTAAHRRNLHIHTYSDDCVISEQETEILKFYCNQTLIPYRVVTDASAVLPHAPFKLLAMDLSQDLLLRFQAEVLGGYSQQLDSFFSTENLLEIIPYGVSKGTAIRRLCSYLQIPLENSVAAGDAQNDISMLEAAHIGAVMKNAYPGIAEHGNYVTEADNNHDGVAEIIQKFIL